MREIRLCTRIFASAVVICIALSSTARVTIASVKAASSDGEATVYLAGSFSAEFDVAYRAVLKPGDHNKSWSTLSILLVGRQIPGPGASVGLVSDASHPRARPFTNVVYSNLKDDYKNYGASCTTGCVIRLRGTAARIYAYVDGKEMASWSRSDLYLQRPYVQLNAEVHAAGDSVDASLTPVRAVVAGHALPHPTCAFTTRGIEPAGLAAITFHGKTNDAGGAFVNLYTGARGDKC